MKNKRLPAGLRAATRFLSRTQLRVAGYDHPLASGGLRKVSALDWLTLQVMPLGGWFRTSIRAFLPRRRLFFDS